MAPKFSTGQQPPLPAGYEIRLAARADLPLLPHIEEQAGRLFAIYDAAEAGDANVTADRELTEAALIEGRLWVATHSHTPVGFALAAVVDNEAYVEELDVLPEHGRRGLGRALVATVCAWAAARRFPAVTLSTRQDIPFNGPFYQRLGFQVVPDGHLTPGLRQLRLEEAARGLDIRRRAVMRLQLPSD